MANASMSCLALLEHETSLLYEVMVDKAQNSKVKLLLIKILWETRTHREVLENLSKHTGYPRSSSAECEREMGELFKWALEFARSIREDVLGGMPVLAAARKLVGYEEGLSEEYASETYSRLNALMEKDPAAKKILEDIAADERRHVETLKLIVEIASTATAS